MKVDWQNRKQNYGVRNAVIGMSRKRKKRNRSLLMNSFNKMEKSITPKIVPGVIVLDDSDCEDENMPPNISTSTQENIPNSIECNAISKTEDSPIESESNSGASHVEFDSKLDVSSCSDCILISEDNEAKNSGSTASSDSAVIHVNDYHKRRKNNERPSEFIDLTQNYVDKRVVLPIQNNSESNFSNMHRSSIPVNESGLRRIFIDGNNVALSHGKGRFFSVEGLQICIDYFLQKGHTVQAIVPAFRKKKLQSTNQNLLLSLEAQDLLIITPSRTVGSQHITSYDDRYVIQCAQEFNGIIVSTDNFRDLIIENPSWKDFIKNRVLPFTWVGDTIIFPMDPLGRFGPHLKDFLRHDTNK